MIDKTGKVRGDPFCASCACTAEGTPAAPIPTTPCAARSLTECALLPPWLVQVILSFNDQLGAEKHVSEALKALGK